MLHVSAAEFSRLVGMVYDSALDPRLWPDALSGIADALRFSTSSLALQELPSGRLLLDVTIGIAPADLARMRAAAADVVDQWGGLERMAALPLEEPLLLSRVNPAFPESRFFKEWGQPLGFIDTLAVAFTRDAESLSSIGFGRHGSAGPAGDDEIALCRLFVPHLKRAIVVGRLVEARAMERATYAAVLDTLTASVLVVGRDRRLVHANRAGETMLRAGEPLRLRAGRVTATNGLASALDVALAAPADDLGRRGLGIPARGSDGAEFVLHVLPVSEAGPIGVAAAAIFVAPAAMPRPAPVAAIAALFELTPAEARVLDLIGAGRTNAEIAATLGIAVSTVRTHLLRLFDKTGTHRQAGLVALLAAFSLPIR